MVKEIRNAIIRSKQILEEKRRKVPAAPARPRRWQTEAGTRADWIWARFMARRANDAIVLDFWFRVFRRDWEKGRDQVSDTSTNTRPFCCFKHRKTASYCQFGQATQKPPSPPEASTETEKRGNVVVSNDVVSCTFWSTCPILMEKENKKSKSDLMQNFGERRRLEFRIRLVSIFLFLVKSKQRSIIS